MRFLFRVTRHSGFVRISINTSQGFPYSAHNLLETRQFRPQLREFFRLFREVILVVTNPMRQIAEFFVWHFGMALFRPRSGRPSTVLLVPNYHQIVIQNENYQRRQRNRQSPRVLVRFCHIAGRVINPNHGIMRPAAKVRVADSGSREVVESELPVSPCKAFNFRT
jgi:hypothetical protein